MNSFFDFSFSKFVTPKVIGIIYFLAFVVAGIMALLIIVNSFNRGIGAGLGSLIVTPIVTTLYLLAIRMGLESLVASITTAQNTTAIKDYLLNNSQRDRL